MELANNKLRPYPIISYENRHNANILLFLDTVPFIHATNPDKKMIRATELKKTFFTENIKTHAIQDISLRIQEGEFVAIMGPSGCGKSTLLSLFGLLDTPTAGRLFIQGKEVSHFNENQRVAIRRGTVGFVFQSFNLIDELTVYENVELPLLYLKTPTKLRQTRVNEILDQLNIKHRRNHFPQQLSGGQQQRTAIARAIVGRPQLILADEPTGNLDSSNGTDVMRLLSSLHSEGTTIVMVTHSLDCANQADRIINLFDGYIVG